MTSHAPRSSLCQYFMKWLILIREQILCCSMRSYHGIDKLHSPKTDYGGDRGRGPKLRSQGSSDWPHQEERRFSTSNLPQQGSPNLAGRSSPVSTRQSSFVDRMSVGDGIRFFYP